ncbi:MAG: sulfatase-like hydrolase/transferase [Planctomycetota bacterium]
MAQSALVRSGDAWRYLDDGSDPGFAWFLPGYDDSAWAAGPSQLGYGEGDEATTVSFGSNPNRRHVTTYFRHSFQYTGFASGLCLRLLRADGAVVYLNGVEVARSNMPRAAFVDRLTLAHSTASAQHGGLFRDFAVDAALLVQGTNVLAVELHKHATANPALSFDLELFTRAPATCQEQGNVLLVIADDVGVDAMASYGESSTPAPTPTIDSLASGGVLFRNVWATPECSPTRACIQTGRLPHRTFVGSAIPLGNSGVLGIHETTLPEVLDLGAGNYAHALIGKWHLGDHRNGGDYGPNLAGWGHFSGLIAGAVPDYYNWPRTVDGVTAQSTQYATSQIVDDALAFIQQQSGPWFCCVSFNAAHGPLQAPPASLHSQNLTGLDPLVTPLPFFHALIEAMDTEFNRLLTSLGPQLSRTTVIFLGDNGTEGRVTSPPFLPRHGKGTVYEGGVNVPMIVWGSRLVGRGREVDALVSTVDLFATVGELAGIDVAEMVPPGTQLDSVSLVPYLTEPLQAPLRQTVFTEHFGGETWSAVNTTGEAAVRDDRYKLIRIYTPTEVDEEFYDLELDPLEQQNLLDAGLTPAEQARFDALGVEFDGLRNPSGHVEVYGESWCTGSKGLLAIGSSGQPRIGASYTVTVDNGASLAPAVLVAASSSQQLGALPLPVSLEIIGGGPNCYLYTSIDAGLAAFTDGTGRAATAVPLPPDPGLVGLTLFHTWVVWDSAAPFSTLGLTTSNAIAVTVGS